MSWAYKKSISGFLAVLSLSLLAIFLVLWNQSNYQSEKTQLKKEIESQLARAYNDVKDEYLLDELIPYMTKGIDFDFYRDTFAFQDEISYKMEGDVPQGVQIFAMLDRTENGEGDEVFLSLQKDTLHSERTFEIEQIDIRGPRSERTFESCDSFISLETSFSYTNNDDTIFSDTSKANFIYSLMSPDFSKEDVIFQRFDDYLKEEDLFIDYQILDVKASTNEFIISHQTKGLGNRKLMIDVINHNRLVFKKLYSSILFSLFLFGLTAWTFWTLIQNKRKQQRLVSMKNEFIGNMTHELKTPISTVGVALEAMNTFGESLGKDKQKEYMEISQHELKRLSLLVDKVLKMASFDNEEVLLKQEKIDLKDAIEVILNSMKLHLVEKNVHVEFSSDSEKALISGDSVHISNVFYNILDNAIKYSDEDPKVDIKIEEIAENYRISFKDFGNGIPREYQDKVFDRFFRLPSNDHHNVKGHGLGLSYVKDVILKHGGSITLESAVGIGSKFVISLPKIKEDV